MEKGNEDDENEREGGNPEKGVPSLAGRGGGVRGRGGDG